MSEWFLKAVPLEEPAYAKLLSPETSELQPCRTYVKTPMVIDTTDRENATLLATERDIATCEKAIATLAMSKRQLLKRQDSNMTAISQRWATENRQSIQASVAGLLEANNELHILKYEYEELEAQMDDVLKENDRLKTGTGQIPVDEKLLLEIARKAEAFDIISNQFDMGTSAKDPTSIPSVKETRAQILSQIGTLKHTEEKYARVKDLVERFREQRKDVEVEQAEHLRDIAEKQALLSPSQVACQPRSRDLLFAKVEIVKQKRDALKQLVGELNDAMTVPKEVSVCHGDDRAGPESGESKSPISQREFMERHASIWRSLQQAG